MVKFLFLRQVLGEEDEKQSNGKVYKKLQLGDYKWMSYVEADKVVSSFGSGLRHLGLKEKDTVSIYGETRQVRRRIKYSKSSLKESLYSVICGAFLY